MLKRLKIKNFVLIEDLELEFRNGLNILTGETGAGKSILIDAISGILGDKVSTDMIRSGCEKSSLEAEFDISGTLQIKSQLDENGIDCEDDVLIIRRDLFSSGKGRCFINSVQIPASKLKEIGEYLLIIHGQNEHQNISRISAHRELLDSFGGLDELVGKVEALYRELSEIKEKLSSFEMDEREKARKIEYLNFAIKEITGANLSINEEEELKEESEILNNAEKIFSSVNQSYEIMKGENGVLTSLQRIDSMLSSISDIDTAIAAELDSIRNAKYILEDSAIFLRNYEKNIDFSPERTNEVEERLALISSLKKKYGGSIHEILQYLAKCESDLQSISSSDDMRDKLKEIRKKKIEETKDAAVSLSEKRSAAALILEKKVTEELEELNMKGTTFKVSIKQEVSDGGEIEKNGKVYMLYPTGLDKVEFMMSANTGESLTQLRKAASGGEMSRIMLALKKVILSKDIVETLIFDEVDAGISGKTAEIVGKKLKSLAGERQVLVITHLPQIAAMSDSHYFVQKTIENNRTYTTVKNLNRYDKIAEVARLLAGETITELSLKHAEEMVSACDGK